MKVTGGTIFQLDQCEYGLTSIGDDGVVRPAKKSSGVLKAQYTAYIPIPINVK